MKFPSLQNTLSLLKQEVNTAIETYLSQVGPLINRKVGILHYAECNGSGSDLCDYDLPTAFIVTKSYRYRLYKVHTIIFKNDGKSYTLIGETSDDLGRDTQEFDIYQLDFENRLLFMRLLEEYCVNNSLF